jgi:hypothetical protein
MNIGPRLFFHRIFSAYYFMLLKLKKINRLGIEDWQAMLFVCFFEIFLFFMLLMAAKRIFHFKIPHINKFLLIGVFLVQLYLNNRYFLSSRKRRNYIIDDFRALEKTEKRKWNLIAIGALVVPMVAFFCLAS